MYSLQLLDIFLLFRSFKCIPVCWKSKYLIFAFSFSIHFAPTLHYSNSDGNSILSYGSVALKSSKRFFPKLVNQPAASWAGESDVSETVLNSDASAQNLGAIIVCIFFCTDTEYALWLPFFFPFPLPTELSQAEIGVNSNHQPMH